MRSGSPSVIAWTSLLTTGNAMKTFLIIPVITFLGMTFADIIAGSIIVEQVFGVPGLGRILLTSISGRDYPVVEAIILLLATAVVVSNLIVDLLYKKFDPRIHV